MSSAAHSKANFPLRKVPDATCWCKCHDLLSRVCCESWFVTQTTSTGMCSTLSSCCQQGKQCKKVPRCTGLANAFDIACPAACSSWKRQGYAIPVVVMEHPEGSVHVCRYQSPPVMLMVGAIRLHPPQRHTAQTPASVASHRNHCTIINQ